MVQITQIPEERFDADAGYLVRSLEKVSMRHSFWMMPIVLIVTWVVVSGYGRTILFLHPAPSLLSTLGSRFGLLVAILVTLGIPIWWFSMWLTERLSQQIQNSICIIIVISSVFLTNATLRNARLAWVFQEAVKARAPRLTFARSIVYMQQDLQKGCMEGTHAKHGLRIGLIGSSQIHLGVDPARLAFELNNANVSFLCLPGMIPLQYASLRQDFADQNFDMVVCWLSEFDFYREQMLPTNRLRWCSSDYSFESLLTELDWNLIWSNRGDLADLGVATQISLWQQRELFQMLFFHYWWPADVVDTSVSKEEVQIGAKLGDFNQGVDNARKNIRSTPLLEANFAAFSQFQQTLFESGTQLLVLEGECHPKAMATYDPAFRVETRQRLRQLSTELHFSFVEADNRFKIEETDWRDAVHLNMVGNSKLTAFLASYIKQAFSLGRDQSPLIK